MQDHYSSWVSVCRRSSRRRWWWRKPGFSSGPLLPDKLPTGSVCRCSQTDGKHFCLILAVLMSFRLQRFEHDSLLSDWFSLYNNTTILFLCIYKFLQSSTWGAQGRQKNPGQRFAPGAIDFICSSMKSCRLYHFFFNFCFDWFFFDVLKLKEMRKNTIWNISICP